MWKQFVPEKRQMSCPYIQLSQDINSSIFVHHNFSYQSKIITWKDYIKLQIWYIYNLILEICIDGIPDDKIFFYKLKEVPTS